MVMQQPTPWVLIHFFLSHAANHNFCQCLSMILSIKARVDCFKTFQKAFRPNFSWKTLKCRSAAFDAQWLLTTPEFLLLIHHYVYTFSTYIPTYCHLHLPHHGSGNENLNGQISYCLLVLSPCLGYMCVSDRSVFLEDFDL